MMTCLKNKSAIPPAQPDVGLCYPTTSPTYIDSGAVENLQNYVDSEEEAGFADDFVSGYWNEGREYQIPASTQFPSANQPKLCFITRRSLI
jgi:hypothetical protein